MSGHARRQHSKGRSTLVPDRPVKLARAMSVLRRLGWKFGDTIRRRGRLHPPRPGSILRVGFAVCDTSKWGLDPMLQQLRNEPHVELGFYCTVSDVAMRMTPERRKVAYEQVTRPFFAARAPVWGDLYDPQSDRIASPRVLRDTIQCDILFIQQPWGMRDYPRLLAGRVACVYVHYGFEVIDNDAMQFGLAEFHPFLWRHFVPSAMHAKAIEAASGPKPPHVVVSGHPKLDAYSQPAPERSAVHIWPRHGDVARQRVIYAPHHSIGEDTLRLGTFSWSGAAVLALAERFPDVDFVLRPHPLLGHALTHSGKMTLTAWENWLMRWRGGPNTALSDHGPYMDMFRTSDLLITDSGAFLGEYMPTGSPILRLTRPGSAGLNVFGQTLSPGFYTAANEAELMLHFQEVLLNGVDPLAPIRETLSMAMLPKAQSAAQKISEEIDRWAQMADDGSG
jgi:hypothetical protein